MTDRHKDVFPMGTSETHGFTRGLLACGAIAGPMYVITAGIQILTRPGFDIQSHAISLLSNGKLGWIQISNFILSGTLVTAGAFGIRRAIHPGRASTWGPLLLLVYGLGLIFAGIFIADPVPGFPPGTSDEAPSVSVPGVLHFVSSVIGFIAFIVACFVFTRRFVAIRQFGWALFSFVTGIIFLGALVGLPSHAGSFSFVVAVYLAIVLAWSWISAISAYFMLHSFRSIGNVGGIGTFSQTPATLSHVAS